MKDKPHIHFVGIKGVGVAPLAIIAKEAGLTVSGCDVGEAFITDASLKKAGISILEGFSENHLEGVSLVITTGAHGGFDNPEVAAAKARGIHVLTQGEAVGEYMAGTLLGKKDQIGISIAGTHGKTTTTAMVATILSHSGKDPSYIVGTGSVASLANAGHFGKGKYFVAEADEYATEPVHDKTPKFLWQHPIIAVVTNIELDHPDVYRDVDSMRQAFLTFANNLPPEGVLIVCGDDPQAQLLLKGYNKRTIRYGMSLSNDCVVKRVRISGSQMFFWLELSGTDLGEFMLHVTGEHNALNATAAILVGLEAGLSIAVIKKALLQFRGSKRRLEYVGELETGALVYDDYAHHPTEIKKTLAAVRAMYPKKHIVAIFQPHTYSRTKTLFSEFLHAFDGADTVVLSDIFPSKREAVDLTVSSQFLSQELRRKLKAVLYKSTIHDVVEYVSKQRFKSDTVLLVMGAGDIYKILEHLVLTNE